MEKYYSDEKNAQILIALLKQFEIRKVIISPGSTNISVVSCMQYDPFFELYSAVDERSAAYMACGLAEESGEPVVISCTGATSSRNYMPGLTEAFYRKLPVVAVTASQAISKVGHHVAQVIDRSVIPKDVANVSVTLPIVKDDDDFWECEVKVNEALLGLTQSGGGPVHIDIPTTYQRDFSTKKLPEVRKIERITLNDNFPEIPKGRIGIFVGAHGSFSKGETIAIDSFCENHNAVVFCDHTSNYKGKYRLLFSLATIQKMLNDSVFKPDIFIYIGEITGDYYSLRLVANKVWKVSLDGKLKDTFRKLRCIFEMSEVNFFEYYAKFSSNKTTSYYQSCIEYQMALSNKIPNLPFSNIWVASKLATLVPPNSTIHFGILNSLRSWNLFDIHPTIIGNCNVGGFGIDGGVSSLVGASLSNKNKLYFGVFGDLGFFYDLNAIGNRHVSNNLRILLVNNGKGTEFRLSVHKEFQKDENADEFISAAGHFGNCSPTLVKNYSQDLGFEYISATNKEEFELVYEKFISNEVSEKPIFFEVFTETANEDSALTLISNIEVDYTVYTKKYTKNLVKSMLGDRAIKGIKKIIK